MNLSCARFGVILAIAFSLFTANVIQRKWDTEETLAHNLFVLVHPFVFPSVMPLHDKPMQEHIAHFAKITKNMEESGKSASTTQKMMGDAYYQPSFGENKTRYIEFTVPASLYGDDDEKQSQHDIPILCTCPHDATRQTKLPLVLYYFGGGLILGSIHGEILMTRWLSHITNTVVCSVGYRTAPEFPYPTPINDALAGSLGVLVGQQDFDLETKLDVAIDYDRVGIWGVSAGAYIGAHVARRLVTTEQQRFDSTALKCLFTLAPMVKPHSGTPSMIKYWNAVWSGQENAYAWASYLPGDDGTLAADWKVSLLVDPPNMVDVLPNLPPTFVQIQTKDILADEGRMYANRLREQGKLIELREYRTSHVGLLPGISDGGPADGSLAYAANLMKDYLHE